MTKMKVSIRHKPGTYNVYRNLSNKPWYALAEYVDNALQSFEVNREAIERVEGGEVICKIDIVISDDKIVISDNAGGIAEKDFSRAFEPANKPEYDGGLSEFGMGLKVASIWFADKYSVRTSAIGESVIKQVDFDRKDVVQQEIEELEVSQSPADINLHFTEVTLSSLSKNAPVGRQFKKVKDHLASIYRIFIREKKLKLTFNGELLSYENPKVLVAPIWNDLESEPIEWVKNIYIELGPYKVQGFIGLLEKMSKVDSGLSLFRRGRVIEGSHDEKFKHVLLTGQPGSPRDKRLFGELELTGFEVSFEKGKFIGGNRDFDSLFKLLSDELKGEKFPLLQQGDRYRKSPVYSPEKTAKNLAKTLRVESVGQKPVQLSLPTSPPKFERPELDPNEVIDAGTWFSTFDGNDFEVHLSLTYRAQDNGFYYIDDVSREKDGKTVIKARLNLEHVFFKSRSSRQKDEVLEAVVRMVQSLVLAEVYSPQIGLRNEQILRETINSIMAKQ